MYGPSEAQRILELYGNSVEGFDYEPYWDVDSVLDSCLPQPTFYEPWLEFGMRAIDPDTLHERIDRYLESVMNYI
jgi:hypothetical protein